MGFGGISPWSLLLILLIVVMIFGTKRLKNMGGDVGSAIKNFKKSMNDVQDDTPKQIDAKTDTSVGEEKVKGKSEV